MIINKVHFIAIGGSAMHNLALALHYNGYQVTGSDDEIAEPSLSRLKGAGLLPAAIGWFPEKISSDLSFVILGMHAREDNPELLAARALNIKVYSYPEYLYEFSKSKRRVVVGGSHGKTSITAMVMHVLNTLAFDFDYMVGAKLQGFETMVKLSNAPLIVLEGDEYLASPVDRRPKFHLYHPDIAVISGIAWDHINVFPTKEIYNLQFKVFAEMVDENGSLIYCKDDLELVNIINGAQTKAKLYPYGLPQFEIINGITSVIVEGIKYPLKVFGKHNLYNLRAAQLVCNQLGVTNQSFYSSMVEFKGAARRLECLSSNEHVSVYKDFAHSPSKLKATSQAVKEQFQGRKVIAVMELHTFSSLNESFLEEYAHCMDDPDHAIVYFNPQTIAHKKLKPVTESQICAAFKRPDLEVITDSKLLEARLLAIVKQGQVYLLMSSGTFDGMDQQSMADQLVNAVKETEKLKK
ncbi:MAG: hypothetical protein RIQ89_1006 [Bacteroidota bacterium]|jgi:UDP-N-acetylmuramate: L-alanyl-gamma-D-glutamyl-meso-diaminopimelate ligase